MIELWIEYLKQLSYLRRLFGESESDTDTLDQVVELNGG